jgi:hypothetical protein
MRKLVIIPGGFHPFHAGHMALYNAAREAFPSAEIFVAATDDTSTRPFPFKTKKFLAQQAGVPGNRFIRVKSPFRAEEITQMYDPDDTVLIFVRSEKDSMKQPQAGGVKRDGSPAYLQPYRRNQLEPFSQHGYMAYLPTVQFGPGMTSATEIRAKWPEMTPEEKISLVKTLYPSTAARDAAAGKIVNMLDEIMGSAVDEGIGRALAGGALAGALAMAPAAQAQTASTANADNNTVATVVIDGQQKVYDLGRMDVKQAGKMLEKKLDSLAGNWKLTVTDGKSRYTIDTIGGGVKEGMSGAQASLMGAPAGSGASTLQPGMDMPNGPDRHKKGVRMGQEFDEATLVNDPDAGLQIRPDGGMGTWDESSLVSNLARKFADMVNMVKAKNYKGLHYVLYQAGVVENMVRALAELESFQAKQGRRPIARGREIDTSDYIEEKNNTQ